MDEEIADRRYSDLVLELKLNQQRIASIEHMMEEERSDQKASKRVLFGVGFAFLLQIGASIYGYGQLTATLNNIDIEELKQNISTALAVLKDHGSEIQSVRDEQARLRGNIDELWQKEAKGRELILEHTKDRFYKVDGARLERRIERLEKHFYENGSR